MFRFISGLGIGAEIAAVTTYLGEISPAPLRGRYTSWATTAAYAGFAVVPFVARFLVPNYAGGWRILFAIGAVGGVTILFMRRGLPASPRWLVSQGRTEEATEVVAEAEGTARDNLDEHEELPPPEPVPDEAPAESFPLRALLRQPMAGRLGLFIASGSCTTSATTGGSPSPRPCSPTRATASPTAPRYLIVSGIGFLAGAYATTRFSDRFERKYSAALFAMPWAISLLVIGVAVSPAVIIVFGFIASATVGLLVPLLYTYTAEHFATNAARPVSR